MKIKKLLPVIILSVFFIICYKKSAAWGPEGHTIVCQIAMHFVKDDVRQNVLKILDNMPIDTAANWMDIMRSNQDYEFMRTWHYIDFARGQTYQPNNDENIVNRLLITFNELKHRNILCNEQIKFDLLVLMHLMGDLHMPLHTAYDDDLGGNRVTIQYDTMKTHNLHRFWDEDIIRITGISFDGCMQLYRNARNITMDTIGGADFVKWMKESRGLLGEVYNYPGFTIDQKYLDKNKPVVEWQLLLAGLRLADILNKLFYSPAPIVNTEALTAKYKNGIDVKDAMKNIGKKITICSRVYRIRSTAKITQITLGDKYPNGLLTVIIFGKNYSNFKIPPYEMYKDKNICVKGKIEGYKGQAQIIIEQPGDIILQ